MHCCLRSSPFWPMLLRHQSRARQGAFDWTLSIDVVQKTFLRLIIVLLRSQCSIR
jgi:hypothetical protein